VTFGVIRLRGSSRSEALLVAVDFNPR